METSRLQIFLFLLISIAIPIRAGLFKFTRFNQNVDPLFSQVEDNKVQHESKVDPTPPDHKDYVAMARFIMHQADWTSIATISQIKKIAGYPFTSVVSMSDGTVSKSVGIPYFYLTPLDFPAIDLKIDNRCTISATLEQTSFCHSKNYVPDDPRCGRVMLTGKIVPVKKGTPEYFFAKTALFSRHHSMANLPKNHGFYVAKLNIEQIVMLDWFGGPIYISPEDYLAYKGEKLY